MPRYPIARYVVFALVAALAIGAALLLPPGFSW